MKVVLLGSTSFSRRVSVLFESMAQVQLTGIVTAPKIFEISYAKTPIKNIQFSDLAVLADDLKVPSLTMRRSLNESGLLEAVSSWKPDMFLVAGWYHIVPRKWRELAPAYGLHASLLPDYRGGAPLVWAIINGEEETGISLFQLEDEVDAGPVLSQRKTKIRKDETIATLYEKVEALGLEMLSQQLPLLAKGKTRPRAQNHAAARWFPPRTPADGLIDWSSDSASLERFVRAQTHPYPGAFTTLGGTKLEIWGAQHFSTEKPPGKPGYVTKSRHGYQVACGSGALGLKSVSFESRDYSEGGLNELFRGGDVTLGS